jgi:hypothetical protein
MKISFDLDDTIIPGLKTFETEPQTFVHRLFGIEKIRKGTIELFRELKDRKHCVGIYTTSFRSKTKIKLTFLLNGFLVDFVINQQRHLKELNDRQSKPSKYPTIFNIDIHIDDSKGVEIEGEKYNFQTIIIDEKETNWTNIVLERT